MHLLFLTPQLPYPPRQGTTIRNYNLIRHLAQRHTVDLLTFLAPGEQVSADSALHQLCRRIATAPQPARSLARRGRDTLTSRWPDMALRLEDAQMHALVRQWLAETRYDVVQVEGIEMAQYGERRGRGAREQGAGSRATCNTQHVTRNPPPLFVFDDHNCEYLLQKRNALTDLRQPRRWLAAAYSLVQWQKLRWYEARICRQANITLAVSEVDRAALAALALGQTLAVIPNGINAEEYEQATEVATTRTAPPYNLVFTGKMDYRPNIDAVLWFGRQVLPLIQAREPEVRFQIVGMNPDARLDELRANPAVEITGAVADPRPYLYGATVYVIPMRVGGGTRFKALEAMASGKAIVSTSLGVEGIDVQHERELLLADTPLAFAADVLSLIWDQQRGGELSRQLGAKARRFVERHYDWAGIVPKLEAIYLDAVAAHRQGD